MSSFLHAGTFGDTVYAMNVVKLLGGGDLHIELNGMDKLAVRMWGGGDAGWHAGRYTQADIDFIMPLIKAQSYINDVKVWDNVSPVDHDLREQYKFWTRRNGKIEDWAGNQTECYALACGVDIHEHRKALLIDPWIDVDPIHVQGKPIVINRTFRHIKQDQTIINPQWMHWIQEESLEDTALFVGSKKEHEDFCTIHDCDVEHREVENMLELAQLIKGCEQFMGNQSMALSLAIALGKTFWCEVRIDYETVTKTPHGYGDVWFPRANGNYF